MSTDSPIDLSPVVPMYSTLPGPPLSSAPPGPPLTSTPPTQFVESTLTPGTYIVRGGYLWKKEQQTHPASLG